MRIAFIAQRNLSAINLIDAEEQIFVAIMGDIKCVACIAVAFVTEAPSLSDVPISMT